MYTYLRAVCRLNYLLHWRAPRWSVVMSTMGLRRQSVRSLAFLQAEWIPMLTGCTSVSIALSQLVRGRPLSPPMTGRTERRPSDPMLILFRVLTCHIPKEAEPSLSDKARNWSTAGSQRWTELCCRLIHFELVETHQQ